MKDMKVKTRLIVGFLIIGVLLLISLYTGYKTAQTIISVAQPKAYLNSYGIFVAVEFVVFAVVMLWISISTIKTISKSVEQLSEIAKEIATGKVDIHLVKRSNDEFGELVDDYQKVVNNIQYQASVVEEVASGNMSIDVHPRSEEDVLGISLRKLVKQNYTALSNISDAAYQVMTSSSQVASASEALAQGSTQQASAIEEITASIGDIAEKTKTNASEANEASGLAIQTIDEVKKGNARMRDMVDAMEAINKSSESISKIIKVIDDIAFQTNILALNAAVEAARAGEAGKGFAVVAEEVRNLAAKSSAAAAETADLIEDSIQKVAAGSNIATETAKALEAITNVVEHSEELIHEIAEASNYQATAIAQIDQAVGQVSQVVQNNSSTSEECAAASVELSNQATRMRDMLSVYNLGSRAGAVMDTNAMFKDMSDRNEQIISLNGGFGKY